MACQPSRTFRLVASSTSKGGTICPAAMASIFSDPEVSFSRRSAKILKCSCSVMLARLQYWLFFRRGFCGRFGFGTGGIDSEDHLADGNLVPFLSTELRHR